MLKETRCACSPILVPRAHDPSVLRQGLKPGSPWITDFRFFYANSEVWNNSGGCQRLQKCTSSQKNRGLCGRETCRAKPCEWPVRVRCLMGYILHGRMPWRHLRELRWKPLNTLFIFVFGARRLQDVSRYYGFFSRTKLLFEIVSSFQPCGNFPHCICVEEEGPLWIPWKEQTCENHGGRRLRLAFFDTNVNVSIKSNNVHPPTGIWLFKINSLLCCELPVLRLNVPLVGASHNLVPKVSLSASLVPCPWLRLVTWPKMTIFTALGVR